METNYSANIFICGSIISMIEKSSTDQDATNSSIIGTIKRMINDGLEGFFVQFNPGIFQNPDIVNENNVYHLESVYDDTDDDDIETDESVSTGTKDNTDSDNVDLMREILEEYQENEHLFDTTYFISIDGLGMIGFAAHDTDFEPTLVTNNICYVHPLLTSLWKEQSECTPTSIVTTLRRFGSEVKSVEI